MSLKLDQIRQKIDALDDRIHDVLMERAALIDAIAEEKRRHNLHFVHPAREARMIRRLLARHRGVLPPVAIVRIWRELVGAVSLMQTGLKISVCTDGDDGLRWDMAKDYFGSVVPMERLTTPRAAIDAVARGEASFAVLPWPDGNNAWWADLPPGVNIVCMLPYGGDEGDTILPASRAVAISKTPFEDSGKDNSFILSDHESTGFDVVSLRQAPGRMAWLAEVSGFVAADDPRLENSKILGGYPVPPVYPLKRSV